MAFVDMPKSVEEVMCKLFAPEFDVSLEEIEDTLNILNHIQDDIKKDERRKVLQPLISVISGEDVTDGFKQNIMKNHLSVYLKPDLAQSLTYLVKEVTENKEHPLLRQPLIPGNTQSSNSQRSENKSILFPDYWDNSSVNFKDVGDSKMMEQVVQGATKSKDGQECENHSLLIPGCSKFPLSRMMYKREQLDAINDSGQYQASIRAECYPEKVKIADEWNASEQFINNKHSWNFMGNGSIVKSPCEETTPMRSIVSIDKYYNMDGGVTPLNIGNKGKHKTKNQQKWVSSGTAKHSKTNEVLLHKVGSNCVVVAVKDKTNRFILPKPEMSRIQIDKNDFKGATVPCKGTSAKSKAKKRRGIDVMALCGGHKAGKMSVCNSISPRGKVSQLNIRKAFEPRKTGVECFKSVGKCTSVGYLKQVQGPWESVQTRFSLLPQNDNQKVAKGFTKTVWVESRSKEGCEVISSPCSGGLRSSSLKMTGIEGKASVDSLISKSSDKTLFIQQLHVDDLEAVDRVGKDKATKVTGQGSITEDEEDGSDVLIIDEDPPLVVDSDGNDSKTKNEEQSGGNTDAKILDSAVYWNGQYWIPAGQDQGHYSDQPGGGGYYCEQAKSSMKADQSKVVKHQGQISQSYLESESSPWCTGPNMMHVRTTSSSSEVDFKKTDSQSNASDGSSPDSSSSADSLSLSQASDGGSFASPKLPEYSFLFNLLKCHDEMETKDDLCKFSWKKILPKKKCKPRRSRRTRRPRATYQNGGY